MPIGTLQPGTPTTVTADTEPERVTNWQGPAVDGPVVAVDVLMVALLALNIQERLEANSAYGVEVSSTSALYNLASTPSLRYVRGFGWYKLEESYSLGEDNPPWAYRRNGGGVWVRVDWDALLDGVLTRTKIAPALVPQALETWGSLAVESQVYKTIDSSVPEAVGLGTTLENLMPGDVVSLTAGPFQGVAGPNELCMAFRFTQGQQVGQPTVSTRLPPNSAGPMFVQYDVEILPEQTDCIVDLYCWGYGNITAPQGLQWLRWKVMRPSQNL